MQRTFGGNGGGFREGYQQYLQQMRGDGEEKRWGVCVWRLWDADGREGEYSKECAEAGDGWDGFEVDQMNSQPDKFP